MKQKNKNQILEQELMNLCLCDFCKKKEATLTIDTPNKRNVPICDLCFKKVNVIAGVMKGKGEMHITEIWDKVKGVNNLNWRDYLGA